MEFTGQPPARQDGVARTLPGLSVVPSRVSREKSARREASSARARQSIKCDAAQPDFSTQVEK
jgi:hypothetical protein